MSPVNQLKTQLQREVAAKQQEQQQAQQQMAQTHMLQQQQVAGNPQQVLPRTAAPFRERGFTHHGHAVRGSASARDGACPVSGPASVTHIPAF